MILSKKLKAVKHNFKKFICSILLGVLFVLLLPFCANAAPTLNASPTVQLIENNLNGAVINLSISGDTFMNTIGTSNIALVRPFTGMGITNVTYLSSTSIRVTLSFDAMDFDSLKDDFAIKVLRSGLTGNSDITSNNMSIWPINESIVATATSNPGNLYESNLDDSIIQIALNSVDFESSISSADIILNNAPAGVSVSTVQRIENKLIYCTLSFNGTNLNGDVLNFSVSIKPSGNKASAFITSNTMFIKAQKNIEGQGEYYITGESYPTSIIVAGYNSRDNKLYLNFDLKTTKTVLPAQTAIFYYFIEIYNSSSIKVGGCGSFDAPYTLSNSPGSNSLSIHNNEFLISSALPPSYRIVVTVRSVIIN